MYGGEDAVDEEAGAVPHHDDRLAQPAAERDRGDRRLRRRALADDDFEQRHPVHRREEVHPDRPSRGRRDASAIRAIGMVDVLDAKMHVGPRDRLDLAQHRLLHLEVLEHRLDDDGGDMALMSEYGTCNGPCSPGDPYMAVFVEDNITFHQNNHFTNNTYKGPWRFDIHEQSDFVPFSTWQASPYNQDAGSTLTP